MKIFNVFQVEGMPPTNAEQDAIAEAAFNVKMMHMHFDDDTYYLVRCTTMNAPEGITITKLDPKTDKELMDDIVQTYNQNEDKFA